MSEPKLEPCPFCGGGAHFDRDDNGWNWIECGVCHASSNVSVHAMEDCKPLLAESWNKRTPPPRTYEQGAEEARDAAIDAIERLREQIEDGSPASNSSDIALHEAQERIRHMALPTQPGG